MAQDSPGRWGPWPDLPPFPGDARVAVWLDGTLASAVAAGWLARHHDNWVALTARVTGRPSRAFDAATALARHLAREAVPLETPAPVTAPAGWALAHHAAVGAGASWLVVGVSAAAEGPPVALQLHAADTALIATGFGGLWAPLLGEEAIALARLALALELPFEHTWDCQAEIACGTCDPCEARRAAFRQLGAEDPAMAGSTS